MVRRLFVSCVALVTCVTVASSPLGATAFAAARTPAPEQPGPPTPAEAEDDPLADLSTAEPADGSASVDGGAGVIVHLVNELPDDDRGLIKLARYHGTTTQAGANVIVVTTNYDEICTEPCGVSVDTSERPIFFFVRDGQPVSRGFRSKEQGEVTLSVRPLRDGMHTAGFYLAIFLVGIPLIVLGRAKVSIAPGPPSAGQVFKKVKRAKT